MMNVVDLVFLILSSFIIGFGSANGAKLLDHIMGYAYRLYVVRLYFASFCVSDIELVKQDINNSDNPEERSEEIFWQIANNKKWFKLLMCQLCMSVNICLISSMVAVLFAPSVIVGIAIVLMSQSVNYYFVTE